MLAASGGDVKVQLTAHGWRSRHPHLRDRASGPVSSNKGIGSQADVIAAPTAIRQHRIGETGIIVVADQHLRKAGFWLLVKCLLVIAS